MNTYVYIYNGSLYLKNIKNYIVFESVFFECPTRNKAHIPSVRNKEHFSRVRASDVAALPEPASRRSAVASSWLRGCSQQRTNVFQMFAPENIYCIQYNLSIILHQNQHLPALKYKQYNL